MCTGTTLWIITLFYEELMQCFLLSLCSLNLHVTVSVPFEWWVFLHYLFVMQHMLLPIEQKILYIPFFWMLLQCSKSHVCHMYVYGTKFKGCCELVLLYTAKNTSYISESASSSHSALSFPHEYSTLCEYLHKMCCYFMKIFTWVIIYLNILCFYLPIPY